MDSFRIHRGRSIVQAIPRVRVHRADSTLKKEAAFAGTVMYHPMQLRGYKRERRSSAGFSAMMISIISEWYTAGE